MFSVDAFLTTTTLSNYFGYFRVMRTFHTNLQYFDWDGQVHLTKGKTGGHQGDSLEILIFNLTIHHLWGLVVAKLSETRAIVNDEDDYIKAKLIVSLQGLVELKRVLKEDVGLELSISKTTVLLKDQLVLGSSLASNTVSIRGCGRVYKKKLQQNSAKFAFERKEWDGLRCLLLWSARSTE